MCMCICMNEYVYMWCDMSWVMFSRCEGVKWIKQCKNDLNVIRNGFKSIKTSKFQSMLGGVRTGTPSQP